MGTMISLKEKRLKEERMLRARQNSNKVRERNSMFNTKLLQHQRLIQSPNKTAAKTERVLTTSTVGDRVVQSYSNVTTRVQNNFNPKNRLLRRSGL